MRIALKLFARNNAFAIMAVLLGYFYAKSGIPGFHTRDASPALVQLGPRRANPGGSGSVSVAETTLTQVEWARERVRTMTHDHETAVQAAEGREELPGRLGRLPRRAGRSTLAPRAVAAAA
jgi:hypothetical protein